MSEWMPIETAPVDGTHVLAAQGDLCDVLYWDGFFWKSHYDTERQSFVHNPTHWQPLPSPPLAAGTAREAGNG